nr:nitrate reductase cytochrome c-type subunit [Campylobacter ureolyticus]
MTRYNCVQCHVPQSNAKTVVNNKFEAVFRDKVLKHGSNLLDVLNQGIE